MSDTNNTPAPAATETPATTTPVENSTPAASQDEQIAAALKDLGVEQPEAVATEEKKVEDTPEKKDEKKIETDPEKDPLAPKFGALARKEQKVVALQKEVNTKLAKLEEESKKIDDAKKEIESIKETFKKDPAKALEMLGMDLEDYHTALVGLPPREKKPEVNAEEIESKVEKKVLERLQKEQEAREAKDLEQRQEEAIKGYKAKISEHIKANKEKYELINAYPEHEDTVYELIKLQYEADVEAGNPTPKQLTFDEASGIVEEYLEKQVLEKIKPLSKVQKLFTATTGNNVAPQKQGNLSSARTLTAEQSTQIESREEKTLTEDEVLQKAIDDLKKSMSQ